ncbi:MAG: MBL fold metallo-hydrolase [Alphaproteobacteria bacterium]
MHVKFWGVRGSIPCSGPETARYGGNSSCVEVRCGDRRLILDAGSGLRPLGDTIAGPDRIDIFLSHCHYDHIIGFPFLQPLFRPDIECRIWAGHLENGQEIGAIIDGLMQPPLFPITLDVYRANIGFADFTAGETVSPSDEITIRTAPLNHPNGATGYRIEHAESAICYVTDTTHVPGVLDQNILGLIAGADLFIYDCTYTDDEFARHGGHGHSTWQEGVRLADAAGVETFVIFHHDPGHDDAFMDRVAQEASRLRPGTIVAQDGLELDV